jgi:putative hydrolase
MAYNWSFQKLSAEKAMLLDYELSKILLKNPLVDVFGHPSGVFSQFFGEYDRDMLRELIDFAVENDKIIELNAGMRYRKVFDIILERCLELDCYISIGSDAHHIDELGLAYNVLKQEIKRFN